MMNAILWMQWKHTRAMVLLGTLIAFSLPLVALQSASAYSGQSASGFVERMQGWGGSYALAAALVGLLVALAAWRPDHLGRHVYALSLPVSRRDYVLYRFGAGALFLAPTAVALLIGCILVAVSGAVPEGLRAYPVTIALRFTVAMLTAYSIFFAIAASTQKTAGLILAVIAGVFLAQFLVSAIGGTNINILAPIGDFLFGSPGILSVFSGRWMLIDV